jgi:indole-3-glycerol phosphate synthase
MPAYLEKIVAAHRALAAEDRRSVEVAIDEALATPAPRPFTEALATYAEATAAGVAVISEIKRRSPSKGSLDLTLDPAAVAVDYQKGGAACLSVLTDTEFFGGSVDDLRAAKGACDLPVLRKDFTVSAGDVCDTRAMGADAVLLIVAALGADQLRAFLSLADRLALSALVEVHDALELRVALEAGARLVGVNQRDLKTFEIDHERARMLGPQIPSDVVAVAESGIRGADDVSALAEAGYRAVLVGETLIRSDDRRAGVAALLGTVP